MELATAAALILAVGASSVRHAQSTISPPELASIKFVEELGLSDETILISDYPGYIAFKTHTKVIAADMLTSNRKFYESMRRSPNALEFIADYAEREGMPIRAVVCLGNSWLVPDRAGDAVIFNDPRVYPKLVPIGWITLGPPVVVLGNGRWLAWRVATPSPYDRRRRTY